ncbi:hypothetical protein HNQ88_004462 [Aureibacter tunicatorum]|uniref:Uncharacterized protein n=1 Tax=Aureibacter tunicatorum TaxID=866807 RepID=A0AAE4BUS6_9BACT|nr:hypothetical protein [Aureibacter tunicatorum]BDD06780.1 hypothetical protein AUTU_42630 [Aureibacter tunicatorum]
MRNWPQILGALLLAITYLVSSYPIDNVSERNDIACSFQQSIEKKEKLIDLSSLQLQESQPNEGLSISNSQYVFSPFKIALFTVFANVISFEILHNAKFKQYIIHLKNVHIRFRKSDLLFPYQYFW